MRAIEISRPGGPEVLRIVERPKPQPAPGEVLVRVHAAGVSRADSMQREGKYPPPHGASDIPGLECAGVVEATGERVCALLTGGGYAEYVCVPSEQVLPIPDQWDFVQAASLPENIFTVYDNLVTRARFTAGESLLAHGGTSGIGSTAIMLARALGASFVASTARTDGKCDALREIGADLAINYTRDDFVEQIREHTNGRGVDVVLDIVGGEYILRDVAALALDGRIVSLATSGGSQATIDLGKMMQRRATLITSSLRTRTPSQKGAIAQALLRDVWPKLPAKDPIRPIIDSVFPAERVAEAHARLDASDHIGKIVVTF